jgi:Tfp pilus assembly protein PilE
MNQNFKKGLSFVEILVAVTIVSVISIAVGTFQAGIFSNDREFRARILANEESRLTLRRFLEETRMASQSSLGSYAISAASNNSFTFYSDSNSDGLKERFRYFISGRDLVKGVIIPTGNPLVYVSGNEKIQYMVHNISTTTASIFTYYDTNNATMTSPISASLVRSVLVSFSITPDINKASTTINFSTRSTLRNLKDNY